MKKSVEKAATVPMTQTQKILAQTFGVITIPKMEYRNLVAVAKRYHALRKAFVGDFFEEPSTTSRKEAMQSLKNTGKYSSAFLKSVQQGMKESSFFS